MDEFTRGRPPLPPLHVDADPVKMEDVPTHAGTTFDMATSRWSVLGRCNEDGKFVSGLVLSPWRAIQCPRDAAQPEVAPPVT
ncbi:unnamed protein product [Mesocestoides corti]|uniref:Uncharacterized protein n=1 Tax=Mesocestoides corti TaxID=53468 RepID=A0A0R3U742_MESCO|nr:unnamed protein product [Mesocestoides corti]